MALSSPGTLDLGVSWPLWEKPNGTFLKGCLAEFFCTTIFIFVATGAVVFGCHSSDTSTTAASAATGQVAAPVDCFLNNSRVLTIASAFGFAIFALIYVSASFSGGHLNPAVTLACLISKKVTLMRAAAYWFCQLAGAVLGSSFVYATDRTGWHAAKGGTNRLLAGVSPASGWLLETLLTMLLVFTVFAATDTNRAKISAHLPPLAPFAIGMAVFISHLIFWVGPSSGAIIAALIYELFFRPSGQPLNRPTPAFPKAIEYGAINGNSAVSPDGVPGTTSFEQSCNV